MSWREVQEALYQRWTDQWGATTPFHFDNDPFTPPPEGRWCKVMVLGRPTGFGTMGGPGHRRVDRRGVVFVLLREPPGGGVGSLSDLAEQARGVYENLRIAQNDVRFSTGDIGDESQVEDGRWWGVTMEAPFDYEDRT